MISFINDYCGFVTLFKTQLDALTEKNLSIRFEPCSNQNLAAEVSNTPFFIHQLATVDSCFQIDYNQTIIDKYDLLPEEVYACVAHSIGYCLIDEVSDADSFCGYGKEKSYDFLADNLGLLLFLASAQIKMSDLLGEERNINRFCSDLL